MTLVAAAAMAAFGFTAAQLGLLGQLFAVWNWPTLVLVVIESMLALIVAGGGAGSFALAWLLISRGDL